MNLITVRGHVRRKPLSRGDGKRFVVHLVGRGFLTPSLGVTPHFGRAAKVTKAEADEAKDALAGAGKVEIWRRY